MQKKIIKIVIRVGQFSSLLGFSLNYTLLRIIEPIKNPVKLERSLAQAICDI